MPKWHVKLFNSDIKSCFAFEKYVLSGWHLSC